MKLCFQCNWSVQLTFSPFDSHLLGSFEYVKNKKKGTRKEKALFWTMDPRAEMERNLTDFANNYENFDPSYIAAIQALYAGDHGKGKHRFACKNVVHLLVPDGRGGKKRDKNTLIYPLADIKASKDTCKVFKGTIHKNLKVGINQVVHGKVLFEEDGVDEETKAKKWKCTIIDKEHDQFDSELSNVQDVTPFMVGDLKFYSQMLGKEDFDSSWCCHCRLKYAQWQGLSDVPGELWTLQAIKKQHDDNEGTPKTKGPAMMGVREYPHFDIPVENYIWPILHTLIGIGNNILTFVTEYADNHIQLLPARQIRLKEEMKELDEKIDEEKESIAFFNSSNTGSGKEMLKSAKSQLRDLKGTLNLATRLPTVVIDTTTVARHVTDVEATIRALDDELDEMKTTVNELTKAKVSRLYIIIHRCLC